MRLVTTPALAVQAARSASFNNALQLTAYSLRSCVAPAFGSG
jgi:hypothetical protein